MHIEGFALAAPVHSGDGPCHTDAQEHIHRVAARHVPNGSVSILVLNGSYFTSKGVYGREEKKEGIWFNQTC